MKHPMGRALSQVGMLRRHGRTPTPEEVTEAYRELAAAKIEKTLSMLDPRGLPLDEERATYLRGLITDD